jgi:hypothetical protein
MIRSLRRSQGLQRQPGRSRYSLHHANRFGLPPLLPFAMALSSASPNLRALALMSPHLSPILLFYLSTSLQAAASP